ncbi:MAG TPA: universal stress protein [Terriglobales bacterium]|nr:universal stress protein [Terriglobales bacterium]
MATVRKILAPTDLSDVSARGVRYACSLAKDLGATVIIINTVKVDELMSVFRQLQDRASARWDQANLLEERLVDRHRHLLDEFVKQSVPDMSPDLNVRTIVEVGEPYATIVDWAKKEQVDVIIMSTHGRSGIPRMMLGSVTEKVLRSSPCPVLAIPLPHES